METIQTAEFNANIIFIILGILFWVFRVINANREKQKAKNANFDIDDQIRKKINEDNSDDLYQKKLEEYAKRKAEKQEAKEKKHILQSYTNNVYEPSPTYQDHLVTNKYQEYNQNYQHIEYNDYKESTTPTLKKEEETHGFKQYQSKKQKNKFGSLLHNKNNLKQAMILSEILKRKY